MECIPWQSVQAGAIWLPRGLWGTLSDKTGFRLFPVGYHVHNRALLELSTTKRTRKTKQK